MGYGGGMAQRRHHYERALEGYLRARRVPYVAVDEAKKTLLPRGASLVVGEGDGARALKSFDFVVYGSGGNLLVEAKGRRLPRLMKPDGTVAKARLESWVTMDDVASLRAWEGLFGEGYEAVFVFVYWCDDSPPDGLFAEVFEFGGRWYTTRAVTLGEYVRHMKVRSPKWRTLNLRTADYERVWRRFVGPDRVVGGDPGLWARDPGEASALEAMIGSGLVTEEGADADALSRVGA